MIILAESKKRKLVAEVLKNKTITERIDELAENFTKTITKIMLDHYGKHPIIILETCIDNKEWFKGIVLSTAFFEGVGRLVLEESLEGKIELRRLKFCSLDQIILLLFSSGHIDQKTYTQMMEVKKYRNKIVHIELYKHVKIEPDLAEKKISKAIKCIKVLFDAHKRLKESKIGEIEEID